MIGRRSLLKSIVGAVAGWLALPWAAKAGTGDSPEQSEFGRLHAQSVADTSEPKSVMFSFGGCKIPVKRVNSASATPVWSDDGTEYLYTRFQLDLDCDEKLG